MEIIKVKSKQAYKDKEGKEHNYYNYYLKLDNGKSIAIKPAFPRDYVLLNLVSKYVK